MFGSSSKRCCTALISARMVRIWFTARCRSCWPRSPAWPAQTVCADRQAFTFLVRGSITISSGCDWLGFPAVSFTVYCPGCASGPCGPMPAVKRSRNFYRRLPAQVPGIAIHAGSGGNRGDFLHLVWPFRRLLVAFFLFAGKRADYLPARIKNLKLHFIFGRRLKVIVDDRSRAADCRPPGRAARCPLADAGAAPSPA